MISFNILLHDFNFNKAEAYDIMPYLLERFKRCKINNQWYPLKHIPTTDEEYKEFVDSWCKYQYWSRCQYEFLMLPWPFGCVDTYERCIDLINSSEKIDAYKQIQMNLDVIVGIFKMNVDLLFE